MAAVVARSLADAYALRASATALLLRASPDLRCVNLMCAKVGSGCACRLAQSLERLTELEVLDLEDNALDALPASVWQQRRLRELRAAGNVLADFSVPQPLSLPAPPVTDREAAEGREARTFAGGVASGTTVYPELTVLDLRRNRLTSFPWAEAAAAFPRLQRLGLSGNAMDPAQVAAGHAAHFARRGVVLE
jgi:Ran GTPase-activating protein (RanGAP) involved in mRNA processing and transport